MNGKFIISLDFELHWGVFDALTLDQYQSNLTNVRSVISKLIELSDAYNVKLTFATVGLLFAENKEGIKKYMPHSIPNYSNKNLDPYRLLDQIDDHESSRSIHYAKSVIQQIKENGKHEIGTHTFGHYNCLAEGQTTVDFDADLYSARKIANDMGIEVKSIVFPKNQVNSDYLNICKINKLSNYRGTEMHPMYDANLGSKKNHKILWYRMLRLLDGYINVSGNNTYPISEISKDSLDMINLPSSRFLRPYIPKLSFLEPLKCARITNAMKHAAKDKELFHLWWHPHNFGANMDENFNNLETIFKSYKTLNETYGFESATMTGLTNEILERNSK